MLFFKQKSRLFDTLTAPSMKDNRTINTVVTEPLTFFLVIKLKLMVYSSFCGKKIV